MLLLIADVICFHEDPQPVIAAQICSYAAASFHPLNFCTASVSIRPE